MSDRRIGSATTDELVRRVAILERTVRELQREKLSVRAGNYAFAANGTNLVVRNTSTGHETTIGTPA